MIDERSLSARLTLSAVAGIGALVLLTGCGGEDSATAPTGAATSAPTTTAASQPPSAAFNDADVTFAQTMIVHHQQAVEMAELAQTRAADSEVKDLAAKIKAAQDPEITTMTGWLSAWGKPTAPAEGHGGHAMSGMMTEEDMEKLKAATGAEFDRMFLEMMIAHHSGAIEMAKTEQAQGINPEAKQLAATIVTAQQAEIEQMRKILDRL
ncbi:DUF305 domain-containing protein [Planomonospora parontospora]|uniref:DUF305 domain-containing protein n=1 Tax=Planomonospora parontospora TaxID=58119 RepID=UPI001670FE9B|nr:DUF305 domain-containing protein [Planomonospora parontospora]GGL57477.1 lipoprotein [Planomonospora parontospora subsp. antibiotica]GII20002.1 lipoprotein [Planomonospora parontospora subsp. antibiotica]